MKNTFIETWKNLYHNLIILLPKIIVALFVIGIFIFIGRLFYRFIGKRIENQWKDRIVSSFIAESAKWGIYIFGIITGLNIMGFGGIASSLIAGAGISAIVFGFAFKDIGENFLAGLILALKRPFAIGDIIEIDGQKGKVTDVDLRITHLRNSAGKDIYIPNATIIKNTLINYTKDGNLRLAFTLGIAPESDIEKTRALIIGYLKQNTEILQTPAFKVVVKDLGAYTTDIHILFWVDILSNTTLPEHYLGHSIRSKIITDIKTILDANAIIMPGPVTEHKMYNNARFSIEK